MIPTSNNALTNPQEEIVNLSVTDDKLEQVIETVISDPDFIEIAAILQEINQKES